MPSIALIGPDGAGKTTIARMLEQSSMVRCKHLYMGIYNTASGNVALPTSRLVEHLKRRVSGDDSSRTPESPPSPVALESPRTRGTLWRTARLVNRLAEEWFRQFASWYYQIQGYVVLYDRHFVFDFAREISAGAPESLDKRIHRWCLTYLYPRPDLVFFLDAPGEVLFARKGELSPAELERLRQAYLCQGARLSNFVRVDATQALEDVHIEIARYIVSFCQKQRLQSSS
jgi:thymidylate kinase